MKHMQHTIFPEALFSGTLDSSVAKEYRVYFKLMQYKANKEYLNFHGSTDERIDIVHSICFGLQFTPPLPFCPSG